MLAIAAGAAAWTWGAGTSTPPKPSALVAQASCTAVTSKPGPAAGAHDRSSWRAAGWERDYNYA
jgi:hypothetical protein